MNDAELSDKDNSVVDYLKSVCTDKMDRVMAMTDDKPRRQMLLYHGDDLMVLSHLNRHSRLRVIRDIKICIMNYYGDGFLVIYHEDADDESTADPFKGASFTLDW
jgi:hypothetical protein